MTAAPPLPPLDRARDGHATAVFKTGAVLPISQHLAVRTAVIRSRALLSSRAYPASLGMLAVLDACTACEDEVPWGAVGEYGVGICLGESVAQCCTGTCRTFLQVGQDDPERA